jgi:UDPglucose 6-dehydrogenase
MKIAVIGTGYVGLVAGVCFADGGHDVICVDRDEAKIASLQKGHIPIYEPGLSDLLVTAKSRISFSTDLALAVEKSEVLFVAVGTPENDDGSADLGQTLSVVESICKRARQKKYIVLKSTVPVGTCALIVEKVKVWTSHPMEIINNPEFLKEGTAVDDFLRPDRVVIGCRSPAAESIMRTLYEPFVKNGNSILFMDNVSAEMTKYAANAFLSVKISFINELALLADKVGADINQVRRGFTSDARINPAFFYPGVGFGGSCFPKDIKALVHIGQQHGIPMRIVHAADEVNDRQKLVLVDKVRQHFKNLKGLRLAVWGLSFKPRTDDVREAPAGYIIRALTAEGAQIVAYDPIASESAKKFFGAQFTIAPSAMAAVDGADALLLVTEWNEFRSPDLQELKAKLKQPIIFDGRNILDPLRVTSSGFKYYCIGREGVPQFARPSE